MVTGMIARSALDCDVRRTGLREPTDRTSRACFEIDDRKLVVAHVRDEREVTLGVCGGGQRKRGTGKRLQRPSEHVAIHDEGVQIGR